MYICMYVCMYVCIYIYVCIYMYVCIAAGILARAICAYHSCVLMYAQLALCLAVCRTHE